MGISLILLILIILFAGTWYRFSKIKEIALSIAKNHCDSLNLDLLDDTVTLSKVKLTRDQQGRLCLARIYQFHCYEPIQQQQITKQITMLGLSALPLELPLTDNNVIQISDFQKK